MGRILIVDDERSIRRTLSEFLRADGHETNEAEDADTALRLLGSGNFDLVVTDVILPRMTGVELLKQIHAAAPEVQVVMMTGEPTVETASAAVREGALDYLFKPIAKTAILRVAANALRVKGLEDSRRRLEEQNRAYQQDLERLVERRTRQLRASEETAGELSRFNQATLDALTAHICVLDQDGVILAVNRAWQDFTAANLPMAQGAAAGANYFAVCDAATGDDKAMAQEAARGLRAVAVGDLEEFSLEYPCHSPGTQRWFVLRATRFGGAGPVRIVLAHEDITTRKKAEEGLRLAHERLRKFVDSNVVGTVIATSKGEILEANDYYLRLIGYSREELRQGIDWRVITPSEWLPADEKAIGELRQRGICTPYEKEYLRRDGTRIPVLLADAMLDGPGEHIAAFALDLTERKTAEAALREREEMMRYIIKYDPNAIAIYDCNLHYVAVSDRYLQDYNIQEQDIIGRHHYDVFPEMPERWQQVHQRCLAGAIERNDDDRFQRPDGSTTYNRWECRPWYRANGGIGGLITYTEVTTARKQAEIALRESEEKYRLLVENAREAIYVIQQGLVRFANPLLLQFLGRAAEQVIGARVLEFAAPEHRAEIEACYRRLLAGESMESRCEYRLLGPEGRSVWLSLNAVRILWKGESAILNIAADVTERKRAEQRVADALNFNRTMIESSPIGILTYRASGEAVFANPAVARMIGASREELLAQNFRQLESWKRSGLLRAAEDAIAAQTEQQVEVYHESTFGRRLWLNCRFVPFSYENQPHLLLMAADVSEKKQLEAQFLRAQRLEGIGALASGIAHDLNNILTPVLMTAPILREMVTQEDGRAMLDTVESCAQRGADIIKQLLTFARGTPSQKVPLTLRHLLRDVEKIVRETFPRDLRAEINCPKDLWQVNGDPTQIHQALMNLCLNARDAMPEGGDLTVEATNVLVDNAFASMADDAKPGSYVCVQVSDTGTGIPPEHLDRIFDPFFTTKEIGKGTGLGLATVLGIVRGHDGFLQVESRPGHGARFKLYFPASQRATAETEIEPLKTPAPPRGKGATILIVDDEVSVRDSLRRTLESNGYKVVLASNGAEGLAMYSLHRNKMRAVVTDMMMPYMNGPAMVTALRALDQKLPILGMSGLPEWKSIKDSEHIKISRFLAKPFSGAELLEGLYELVK